MHYIKYLLILFLFTLLSLSKTLPQTHQQTFKIWLKQNQITFVTPQQQQKRKQIFIQNLKKITQFKISHKNAPIGINYLTGFEDQEFKTNLLLIGQKENIFGLNQTELLKKKNNQKKQRKFANDVKLLHEKQKQPNLLVQSNNINKQIYPQQLNWVDKGKVTSIKMQGNCPVSSIFSTLAMAQSYLLINNNDKVNINIDLSQQYILECMSSRIIKNNIQNQTLNQTPSSSCLTPPPISTLLHSILPPTNLPLQNLFPYNPYTSHFGICSSIQSLSSSLSLSSYIKLQSLKNISNKIIQKYYQTDQQIIELLQNGPLIVAVSSFSWKNYQPFNYQNYQNQQNNQNNKENKQFNQKFLMMDKKQKQNNQQNKILSCRNPKFIDNTVLLVGYDKDKWIIKNSWSQKFGDHGYIYITRNKLNNQNCMIGIYLATFAINQCQVPFCQKCQSIIKNNNNNNDSNDNKDKNTHLKSCLQCLPGYYLSQTSSSSPQFQCIKCLQKNCDLCYNYKFPQNQGICYLCKKGFSLNYKQNYTCEDFSNNVMNINLKMCKYHFYFNQKAYCAECWNGYVRSGNYDSCVKCEVDNCISCMINDPKKCIQCEENYQGTTCKPKHCPKNCISGCKQPGICFQCPLGYSDFDCSIPQCNISHCSSGCQLPNICNQCDIGFKQPSCQPIFKCELQHCSTGCIEDNICIQCDSGYTGANCSQIICYESIKNCQSGCNIDPRICNSCKLGYYGPQCDLTYDDISISKIQFSNNNNNIGKTHSVQSFYKQVATPTNYIQTQLNQKIHKLILILVIVLMVMVFSWVTIGVYIYCKRHYVLEKKISFGKNNKKKNKKEKEQKIYLDNMSSSRQDIPSIKISEPLSPIMQREAI